MEKLLKFVNFVNELKGSSYVKAGTDLIGKGHRERGEKLIDYGKNKKGESKNYINYYYDRGRIEEVHIDNIELKGKNWSDNVVYKDSKNDLTIVELVFDDKKDIIDVHSFIADRSSAFKMFKLIKDRYSTQVKITVNDLYSDVYK